MTENSDKIFATSIVGFFVLCWVFFVLFWFFVLNQKGLESRFEFTKYFSNFYINPSDD